MTNYSLDLPEESFRLKIKMLAENERIKFARKGLSDIFDILSEVALLVRKPLDTDELSGFSTYFEDHFIVYLNSNFTLGHERYTGAHELYHIIYNSDILKKEKILMNDELHRLEDLKADVFASEFLMPEDYVKEVFYKIVNVDKHSIMPRHIVRMHNFFKVSYKAMLKRLIQLDLCSSDKYGELSDICSLENIEQLQDLARREGYGTELIVPTKLTYIPTEYIEFVKGNYERGNISYGSLKKTLGYIGLTPEQLGYEYSPVD